MVFEEKTLDLMALLKALAGDSSPAIPVMLVVPRPLTPFPGCTSAGDAVKKKRKRGQGGKSLDGTEEGEITCSSQQPPPKKA